MPKVSIIVTAYNIERYIAESLGSITGQTLQDIEIIVVDDGSSDGTPAIIRDFAALDPRIRPILLPQNSIGGVATPANAGMDVATGDFIGFADGDDRYDPEMFEKLWRAATESGADLAMCRYMLLDESDGTLKEPAETARWIPYPEATAIDLTPENRREILRFISVPWRKLYRRDLVERAGLRFPVGDFFFEDNPFHWMAVIEAERLAILPERLCDHRVARVGQTMATVDERLLRIFRHHDIIRDWLASAGYLNEYRADLLKWVAGQLSWVSQRAEGDIRRALYDVMLPVIGQYDGTDLDGFAAAAGSGRTAQMLRALKAQDFAAFGKAAGWDMPAQATPSRSPSLLRHGLYHLRHSGLRRTASMTTTVISDRLGLGLRRPSAVQRELSNDDLMLAMVLLQRELHEIRAELAALRRETQPAAAPVLDSVRMKTTVG